LLEGAGSGPAADQGGGGDMGCRKNTKEDALEGIGELVSGGCIMGSKRMIGTTVHGCGLGQELKGRKGSSQSGVGVVCHAKEANSKRRGQGPKKSKGTGDGVEKGKRYKTTSIQKK